jgi:hypothetical protein
MGPGPAAGGGEARLVLLEVEGRKTENDGGRASKPPPVMGCYGLCVYLLLSTDRGVSAAAAAVAVWVSTAGGFRVSCALKPQKRHEQQVSSH